MREILFRGKRKDFDNEWVYGFYTLYNNNRGMKPTIVTGTEENCFILIEVIPETVGQYTGLTDKNGKKIFDGDILAFSDRLTYVHWHEYCGCWDCSYIKSVDGKKTSHEERNPNRWRFTAEVVGNIHDNPELLKEE